MLNEQCFALNKGECDALSIKKCAGCDKCVFFKPKWMYDRDRSRANRHIAGLSDEQQTHIAEKYFGGEMPWRTLGEPTHINKRIGAAKGKKRRGGLISLAEQTDMERPDKGGVAR